ncbi:ABC transporter permease [Candidatus Peregrinibacteria bacterium]|nr:ABC transporter permease [Candidatus Peregrinibacteria bacterium]
MRKFFVLLKKEIKELLTPVMVVPFALMVGVFALMGQFVDLDEIVGEEAGETFKIVWINEDAGSLSKRLFLDLEKQGFEILEIKGELPADFFEVVKFARENEALAIVKVPPKFSTNLRLMKFPKVEIYNLVKDFSIISSINSGKVDVLKSVLGDVLSALLISERLSSLNPEFLKNPINAEDHVIIGNKHAKISFNEVMIFVQSQNTVVPILLILVIIIAAQMVAVAVASEKENKTFEILLSSPVNRKSIVFAKILAAALVAFLFSGFYMVGFNFYMSGFGMDFSAGAGQGALVDLGVVIQPFGYLLIAGSLFLATLCALAIAIILGILAEDVKGVQMVTTPLIILIIIPYMITLFVDVNSLSLWAKYLIYAIPFSHPFLALTDAMTGKENLIIYGLFYQGAVFLLLIVFASKIFTSDKVLTIKLKWGKK